MATLLATVAAFRFQASREPRKRLVWSSKTQRAGIDLDSDVRQGIQLFYHGNPVDELTLVEFKVENAGNRVVRDHQVRLEFPQSAVVVDSHCSPVPDRELGVERRADREQGRNEVIYSVGQLERDQSVTVKILASGAGGEKWRPISHSPEGDVQFVEGSVVRTADDSEHVVPFCFALLLLAVLAGIGTSRVLMGQPVIVNLAALLVFLTVLGFALRHLAPAVRFVRDVMLRWYETRGNQVTVHGSVSALSIGDSSSATQSTTGNAEE
ncbi:hypothetical protein ACFPA8_12160 [Streptomyces ovatisporus]|uniref:Uncharacterized protein n=1 Tax=Streptomyces ovatisporus TaxID=1128682 RepID=A0ABV9A7B8_9ACTN